MSANFGSERTTRNLAISLLLAVLCCVCVEWLVRPVLLANGFSTAESREPEPQVLAEGVGRTALRVWNETGPGKEKWNYERGVLLIGLQRLWGLQSEQGIGDAAKYFEFVQRKTDQFIQENGTIATYNAEEYSLDNILSGRSALFLWNKTGSEKYAKAAKLLRLQLRTQNRTKEGGFWHKAIYPNQMWLDGLYMAEPFYAEYAATFDEPEAFDDIARQLLLVEAHMRDNETGLYYHGYDESRVQNWSDPVSGVSPSLWGRADGWLAMALVDTLDYFPLEHPQRGKLVSMLESLAAGVAKVQDAKSAVWWEVLDQGSRSGNYLESSASAMFVYAIAKGVRLGYVPTTYRPNVVTAAYRGIVNNFITSGDENGSLNFTRTVSVGGLGGDPYRNGTFAYYISEAVVSNDSKGVGPFLMASIELSS